MFLENTSLSEIKRGMEHKSLIVSFVEVKKAAFIEVRDNNGH